MTLCREKLEKSIELQHIESRKQQILQIAKQVDNVKVINKNDPVITNSKINITID